MTTMGSTNSTPSLTESQEIAIVREEAGKLFLVETDSPTAENPTYRSTCCNNADMPRKNLHSDYHRNSASKAVRKILQEASDSLSADDPDGDWQTDHTRSTSGSPYFPPKPRSSGTKNGGVHLKPRPGSLVAHMKAGFGMLAASSAATATTATTSGDSVATATHSHPVRSSSKKSSKYPRSNASTKHPPRSCKIPVRSASRDQLHSSKNASDDEWFGEDAEHLKRIYDMRTWDMYLRITEARKKAAAVPLSATAIPVASSAVFSSEHHHGSNINNGMGGSYGHYIESDCDNHGPQDHDGDVVDDDNVIVTHYYSTEHDMVFDLDED